MYAQDYDEQLVPPFTGPCPSPNAYGWGDILFPYVKNVKVFDCPSASWHTALIPGVNPPRLWRDRGGSGAPARQDCVTGARTDTATGHNYNYGLNTFSRPAGQPDNTSGPFWFITRSGIPIMPNGNMAAIPSPASTAGIAEGRGASPWSLSGGAGSWDYPSVDGQVDARRHVEQRVRNPVGAVNIMYMDGHSKFTNLAQSVRRPGNIWSVRDDD